MRNKKFLLVLLLMLGVGFAAVSATLLMTGNVTIATNNANFDVIFTKAVLDGTDISSTAIIESGKKITFGTKDLVSVGDISKLDFEVTNNSEMYDAEVSINCTAGSGENNYYQITKEVASPIKAKRTGEGKIEVSLLNAPVSDLAEDFTCTLSATATERDTVAKAKYIPKYFAFQMNYFNITTTSTTDYTTLTYPHMEEMPDIEGQPAKVFIGLDADGVQKSTCTLMTGSLECFKAGVDNVVEEQAHLREVFKTGRCSGSDGSDVLCRLGDFSCIVGEGRVSCDVYHGPCVNCFNGSLSCSVDHSGGVGCWW